MTMLDSYGNVKTADNKSTGRLPDFLIIGAMKSGTTSLFDLLCRHPGVFMCDPKEPGFFSRDEVFAQGIDWYRSLFADAAPNQILGEASTCYSRYPAYGDTAARVYEELPDAKLIYMMRHPVERAYSHYTFLMRHKVDMTFEEAIQADASIIEAGMYVKQIEQYRRFYPQDNLCLVTLDAFRDCQSQVLERIQRFVGLNPMDLLQSRVVQSNRQGDVTARRKSTDALKRFRKMPGVKQVADAVPWSVRRRLFLGLRGVATKTPVGDAIAKKHYAAVKPLSSDTRQELLSLYSEPNKELERMLGEELPGWYE